jgi:hypothetical protein
MAYAHVAYLKRSYFLELKCARNGVTAPKQYDSFRYASGRRMSDVRWRDPFEAPSRTASLRSVGKALVPQYPASNVDEEDVWFARPFPDNDRPE